MWSTKFIKNRGCPLLRFPWQAALDPFMNVWMDTQQPLILGQQNCWNDSLFYDLVSLFKTRISSPFVRYYNKKTRNYFFNIRFLQQKILVSNYFYFSYITYTSSKILLVCDHDFFLLCTSVFSRSIWFSWSLQNYLVLFW